MLSEDSTLPHNQLLQMAKQAVNQIKHMNDAKKHEEHMAAQAQAEATAQAV